jgi:HKD family nuclease/predicted house-cleaning noncanonical NTP pyrophosphatase (MazG superfamily)
MNEISLLVDLFDKHGDFEAGLVCTYNLNLNFFENYLLDLNALRLCDSLSIFTDSSSYAGLIDDNPKWLNKKYLVTSIPSRGVFHPKIYLLTSEKRSLLALGSANLTREGMTSNLELLSLFEVSKEQPIYYSLLVDVIGYFKKIAERSGSSIAQEKVRHVEEICSGYSLKKADASPHFIHNLENPLMDEIKKNVDGKGLTSIQIISPFYDTALAAINALNNQFPNTPIEVIVQQGKSNFPINSYSSLKKTVKISLYKNVDRYIHGKSFIFNYKNKTIVYMGSANCTRSAFLENTDHGNYEVGLIGEITKDAKTQIVNPLGTIPQPLSNISDLAVAESTDVISDIANYGVYFILQAVKNEDNIVISINDKNRDKFKPKSLIALNTNENVTITLPSELKSETTLSYSKDLKSIKAPFLIKMAGQDDNGKNVESNIAWVINLEANSGDTTKKKYRRLYTNPFELAAFIQELIEHGDIEELTRFLLTFDVPLDLLLPPHLYKNKKPWMTEGNIEGTLTQQKLFMLTGNKVIDLYNSFLDRLLKKLSKHLENPQKEKISNFIYIISMIFSMIQFLNHSLYTKYKKKKVVSTQDWAEIRAYYNLLLSHLTSSWSVMWDNYSYRDQISNQLSLDNEELNSSIVNNFEDYIIQYEYFDTIKELVDIANVTINNFVSIRNQIMIDTGQYGIVEPKIFERDTYLSRLDEIRNKFIKVLETLNSYKNNLSTINKS